MSRSGSTRPIVRTIPDRSFASRLKRWWKGTDAYDGIGTAAPSGTEGHPPAPITINIPPQGVQGVTGPPVVGPPLQVPHSHDPIIGIPTRSRSRSYSPIYRGRSRSRSSSYDQHPPMIVLDPHPVSYEMPVTNVMNRSESRRRRSRSSFREPQIVQVPSPTRSPEFRSPPPIIIAAHNANPYYAPSYGVSYGYNAPYGPGYGAPESSNSRSYSMSNQPRPNYEQPDVRSRRPVTPQRRRTSPPPIVVQPDVRSRRPVTPQQRRTSPPPIVVQPRSPNYESDDRLRKPVTPWRRRTSPPPIVVDVNYEQPDVRSRRRRTSPPPVVHQRSHEQPDIMIGGIAPVQPPQGRRYERPDGRSRQGGVLIVPPSRSPNYERPNTRSRPPVAPPTPVIMGDRPRMPSVPGGNTHMQPFGEPSFERPLDSRSRKPPTPVILSDPSQPPSRGRRSSQTRPAVISGRQGRRTVSQPRTVVTGDYMSQPTKRSKAKDEFRPMYL